MPFLPLGGQAVIEGVMMRSPTRVAVAVRRPDGSLAFLEKHFESITRRIKPLGWPVLRGAVTSYVGVDNNPHFLEQARLDFPTIDFRLAAAQRLPAADGEFDVAVCCDVLMHVEDMVPVLAELVRVARCGVVLRVRTGNPSLKARMVYDPERDRLFKRLSGGYGFTYYNLLSRRTLRTLLQRVGVTEFHMSGYAPPDADVCAKSLVSFEVPACRKLSSL